MDVYPNEPVDLLEESNKRLAFYASFFKKLPTLPNTDPHPPPCDEMYPYEYSDSEDEDEDEESELDENDEESEK